MNIITPQNIIGVIYNATKGKGKKENAGLADNTRTVETVEIIAATTCNACGESLDDVECKCYERRTRIDIIFDTLVSSHIYHWLIFGHLLNLLRS